MAGRRTRAGAVIAAVSAVYFVAMRFFVMPSVGSWGFADLYKDSSRAAATASRGSSRRW